MAWRTWKLHWATLVALALLETGILVALAFLHHLSDKNQGFTRINQNVAISVSAGGHNLNSIWNVGFLWTSLPSLLMILFSLTWAAVVDGLAEETPMRELAHGAGSHMKKTLLLDYRRYLTFFRWYHAFKNRHILLGICMLLTTVNSIVLIPLAARLFALASVTSDKPGTFLLGTFFNTSADIALVDYAPILATVTAVQLHGGTWPTYTDGRYAYATFIVPAIANLTQSSLNITGYGANLDCAQITTYNISRLNDVSGSATIALSATDRGCLISFKGGVGSGSNIFLKTQSTIDCSQETGYSRISFFAGSYAPSAPFLLDNLSVVSCIPSYNKAQGVLTVPPSLHPLSFSPQGQSNDARISNWQGYEQDMLSLSNIGNSDSPDFTSAFGELTLGIAKQKNPASPLSADVLITSTADAFSYVFAIFAEGHLFDPLTSAEDVSGVLTVSETRLTVVTWSTYTSIGILALLIILTVILVLYLGKHKPLFPEEPRGIASYASLLYGSHTYHSLLTEANQSQDYDGNFYKWLTKAYLLGRERCTLDETDRLISIQALQATGQEEMTQQQQRPGYTARGVSNLSNPRAHLLPRHPTGLEM